MFFVNFNTNLFYTRSGTYPENYQSIIYLNTDTINKNNIDTSNIVEHVFHQLSINQYAI